MRILITGGAGYIGSVCAELLVQNGHQILVLDSLIEGHAAAVPQGCELCECDLFDVEAMDAAFQSFSPDAVMHFAAEAEVEKSVRLPSLFYRVNVAGGIQLVDSMIRNGVRRFVFSSTAAVYGEPREIPITEDHPKAPVNPYGHSKLRFEQILADYARDAGLKHVVLRYFNAAGASQQRGESHRNETHLIARLLEVAAGQREFFEVCGADYPTADGTCVRDFVHVLDIANAHVLALESLDRISGEAFNIGNSSGHSILQVLSAVRQITDHSIPSKVASRRAGDPAVLVASFAKIQRELGWLPKHSSMENIVESAWIWKQKHPSGYLASDRAAPVRLVAD